MPQAKLIWNGAARDAFRLSFPIEKTEKLDDGRLAVYGVATSEALDYDGEVMDYDAAKAAFGAWPGNIREQHDPKKAIGRAIEVTADDDAKRISVKAFISADAPPAQTQAARQGTGDIAQGSAQQLAARQPGVEHGGMAPAWLRRGAGETRP